MRMVVKGAMACCKLYISESRNEQALGAIAGAAAAHGAIALLNTASTTEWATLSRAPSTRPHHSGPHPPLHAASLDMVSAALSHIDLQEHAGSHPRLGVVDHICFHPLGAATLPAVASLAQAVAKDIGLRLTVPTFVYGAAHRESRPLDVIRRTLGYFSSNADGQWLGAMSLQQLSLVPDFGPGVVNPKSGVVVVGACPWIANFNIPILSNDLQLGGRIARKVSSRGGGLPAVQAMALFHGPDRMEIACNLTDAKMTSADLVQEEVARLADMEGLSAESGYFTDYSEEKITEMAYQKLFCGHQ